MKILGLIVSVSSSVNSIQSPLHNVEFEVVLLLYWRQIDQIH